MLISAAATTTTTTTKASTTLATAEKLKLNLELAKRKLKLQTLLIAQARKKAEVNTNKLNLNKEECNQEKVEEKDDSERIIPIAVTSGPQAVVVVNDSVVEKVPEKKETVHDLLKKQDILRASIERSKEANRELKEDKEIEDLKEFVEKQRRMLQQHGEKITYCSSNIQQCSKQLEETINLKAESEARIDELEKRKAVMEKLVSSTRMKIIDNRRKRNRLLKRKREMQPGT
mmetsp:Transcript_11437/g.14333  ORF Transcript_11437/g.14333 Transcript_11437/m.14333 type:complete len:231 (+) Transcript_11437:799-1491(+)